MCKSIVKKDEKGITTLFVDGKPFFMRSGEIHNSSACTLEVMEKEIWPQVRQLNLNSLIVPIYWECIEKEEGKFDFALVDGIINQARKEGLKLVFLWFGLWKNAESMYVPAWIKTDSKKYFRAEKVNGDRINTVSPLCKEAVEADKKAFSTIMAHIKSIDEDQCTVIGMQVENEIGLLGTPRDYSAKANELFESKVPEEIGKLYDVSSTWKEAFKDDAEEFFMAYHFAKAVEEITEAGQKEYNLPCYANAWLKQYPWIAGTYPSGGPNRSVHKIWKAMAPSLFALAPDVYVPFCADVMDEYAYEDNALFIPEIRKDAVASSYALYATLHHNALCFSPFGIEELALNPELVDKPPMEVMIALNIDPSAFDTRGSKEALAATYKLLDELEPLYLQYRGTDKLQSYVRHGEYDYGCLARCKEYDFKIGYSPRTSGKPLGSFSVFELSDNKFLLIGLECSVSFNVKAGENKTAEIVSLQAGHIENGQFVSDKLLNGDEKMALRFGAMPAVFMLELFKY
ncbi:DUF5597 domain-containing protein [Pseudobutyrivibrio sp.]|uniref:DUF5597 domain-containing protein n=1 Tax=Pseudobutyrivibrio sp. TaxID=2014367 RepID=UPI001DE7568D|nr:DUF5597 domain-containing protein [Pseudobutyrivibrio sp.]MBE5911154.1 hypothetical protein [Pseudobutyrivibrio sp.]